ncbi:MAG: orotidine 5'-phosphate decarboxylase / HUMPS family protein [bacterium]
MQIIQKNPNNKLNPFLIATFIFFVLFSINPIFGIIFVIAFILYLKNSKTASTSIKDYLVNTVKANLTPQNLSSIQNQAISNSESEVGDEEIQFITENSIKFTPAEVSILPLKQNGLQKRKKYLHIALNNSLEEARSIIQQLPTSDRILIEVGTPMIKHYGTDAIEQIKSWVAPGTYIVADNKCADLASREVEMIAQAGANASTCLGVAPIETIDSFIAECQKYNVDSMIDMMNVEDSLTVLKKLKKLPDVVILHRGVDETEIAKSKQIPLYQIKQIKGNYNILVAVAGGDTIKEIQSALFNDADIVVVWKNFYQASGDTAQLATDFLKEIK